jgi:hypothetical protein
VQQLAQIERREARLRRIKAKLVSPGQGWGETVARTPQQHHHIGISQNQYQHIGTFLQRNSGDPAVKVSAMSDAGSPDALVQDFLPKLKRHLLNRILLTLDIEDQTNCSPTSVLIKHDRLYSHNIMRINYTTYDVRRRQDTVSPSTSHCNVMVLANRDDHQGLNFHPFRYARVLGIYHANVVYVGPGMTGYEPRRMEFLWVRWYHLEPTNSTGWSAHKLDRIRFPPIAEDDSFGFIDPSDVLRSCHIIPAFACKKVHEDNKGLSRCARDLLDWVSYYVNR